MTLAHRHARLKDLLSAIYGPHRGAVAFKAISPVLKHRHRADRARENLFSHKDVVLIAYGDSLQKEGLSSLSVLHQFVRRFLSQRISMVHLLPFFPYSSDDGFSVTDFFAVNPRMGTWKDVVDFSNNFEMMFDLVLNHFSAQSPWFANYLDQVPGYEDLAITVDPATDLTLVTRPRTHPLLTPFQKTNGETVYLWTTFSPDQIDFNYDSLATLKKIVTILDYYVAHGAQMLRLDAIAYLWKQIGTPCIHLPRTHLMVKFLRAMLDIIAPHVLLLTETNVPHSENISYFGNGSDEAQMVYNFTLAPLLLHTFIRNNAEALTRWATQNLKLESATTAFLNFTASHDGIGVRPLEGILGSEDIRAIIEAVEKNGGQVSYKQNSDGIQTPYELNITYVDALGDADPDLHVQKFLASQAIQYALPGVPATYIHSLIGSHNWQEGVRSTGRARTINRQPLAVDDVIDALNDTDSFRARIFSGYMKLIDIRTAQTAFHPKAPFEVLSLGPNLFAIKRKDERQTILALTNVTPVDIHVDLPAHSPPAMKDLISGKTFNTNPLYLEPYRYVWLEWHP